MYRAFPLANRGRARRAFELRLAQFRDPQSRVDVIEVHQAIKQGTVTRNRTRLSSPGEWQVGAEALGVPGPEAGNFAALAIEITTQFSGNIEHARAATVVAFVEHVVRRPEIMRAAFRHFVLRDFARMFDIGHVHDVADGPHRNPVPVFQFGPSATSWTCPISNIRAKSQ